MSRYASILAAALLAPLALPAGARAAPDPAPPSPQKPGAAAPSAGDPRADVRAADAAATEAPVDRPEPGAPISPSADGPAAEEAAPDADADDPADGRARRHPRPSVMSGIRIYGGDGRCLAVHGDRIVNGAPAVLAPCHGRSDQRWSITPGGRIRGARGYCLDLTERPGADDAPVLPGADVIMTRCDGREDDQTFSHTERGELRVHEGACLGLDHAGRGEIARVEIRPCDGSPDQRWSLGTPPAPRSPIRLTAGDGDCPDGYVALPVAEARAALATLCVLLDQETTVRLADGGALHRAQRGCSVREQASGSLAHTLCRPRAVNAAGRSGAQK